MEMQEKNQSNPLKISQTGVGGLGKGCFGVGGLKVIGILGEVEIALVL